MMSDNISKSNSYKNQHYLPRLYLKNFTSLDVPGKMWALRRGHQYWSHCSVKNVARSEYLHSILEDSGNWNHDIEKMFSEIENGWKPILEKVLKQCPLTNLEESAFAQYLGILWQRTPTAVEPRNEVLSQLGTGVLHLANSISTGKRDLSGVKVRHSPLRTLLAAVQAGMKAGGLIWAMEWKILYSQPPNFFITSDHPVCLANPANIREATGLANPEVEFTVPLSRQVALLAVWQKPVADIKLPPASSNPRRSTFSVGEETVADINKRTVMWARRELIAPTRNFPAADEITQVWRQFGPRRDDEPEEIGRFSIR